MKVFDEAPEDIFRSEESLGVWEHRGKVAAVGIGFGVHEVKDKLGAITPRLRLRLR